MDLDRFNAHRRSVSTRRGGGICGCGGRPGHRLRPRGADEQLPVARGDRIAGRRATPRGARSARPRAHAASTRPGHPEFVPSRLCQRPNARPNTPVPPVASRRTPPRTHCSITS